MEFNETIKWSNEDPCVLLLADSVGDDANENKQDAKKAEQQGICFESMNIGTQFLIFFKTEQWKDKTKTDIIKVVL